MRNQYFYEHFNIHRLSAIKIGVPVNGWIQVNAIIPVKLETMLVDFFWFEALSIEFLGKINHGNSIFEFQFPFLLVSVFRKLIR